MSDAYILFPNDAPPQAQQSPATGISAPVVTVLQPGKAVEPSPPAGSAAKPDDAAALFKDGAVDRGAEAVTEILGGFASSAVSDGDGGERSRAIDLARDGLLSDAKAHGMDTGDLADVMSIVKELQSNTITEPSAEQGVQRMLEGLEACRQENIADADLDLGRRFVMEHLEKIAPGTAYTLERTGAGNEIRVIRAVIAEAKRRGYR